MSEQTCLNLCIRKEFLKIYNFWGMGNNLIINRFNKNISEKKLQKVVAEMCLPVVWASIFQQIDLLQPHYQPLQHILQIPGHNQSINPSIKQATNQPIIKPVFTNQTFNSSIHQSINQLINRSINQPINLFSKYY